MTKTIVNSNISLADSEYVSFSMSSDYDLTIHMKSWEEKPFKIIFIKATRFFFSSSDAPKEIYQLSSSSFLENALSRKYIKIPIDHPYSHFQIEDIDEFPFIQVIAKEVILSYE